MLATVTVLEIGGTLVELEIVAAETDLAAALRDVRAVLREVGIANNTGLTTEQYADAAMRVRA